MESQTVQVNGASVPAVSAKIERGQRGGYGWELRANVVCQPGQTHAEAFEVAITSLTEADGAMRRLVGATEGAAESVRPAA